VLLEQTVSNPQAPITESEAKKFVRTGQWDDDPALRLVVQDADRAENFEKSKQFVMGWTVASALYQSPYQQRFWEGTQVERASVPFYTLATAVNGLVPQILNGLFYETPPFLVQERPGTTAQAARAWSAVLAFQLEDIGFREECRLGIHQAALYGTAIWKYGWESYTQERKVYALKAQPLNVQNPVPGSAPVQIQSDDIEEEIIEEIVDRPVFEHLTNLGHVLVDPKLDRPDISKARFVVHRKSMTFDDLDKLRDRPGFEIPSREELIMLFFPPRELPPEGTDQVIPDALGGLGARAEDRFDDDVFDPFSQPLEVLERWDKDRVICVLQRKLVICNDDNPYGAVPFLSVNWWDVPESFWGLGLGKLVGSEQRLQQGITCTWLDQAALNLNGVFVRVKGKSVPTQSIRIAPGRIIDVDSKDDFTPLGRTPAVPEAGMQIQMSQSRTDLVAGTDAGVTGAAGASGHSNLARSSAGAQMLGAGSSNRTGDFVEKFSTQVLLRFLYAVMQMNRALLPVSTLRYILNEELQNAFLQDEQNGGVVSLLNARMRFTISAGAKMQARRAMAQSLPILTQFLSTPAVHEGLAAQQKKVDISEVLRMFWEVNEWKNYSDVIVPMTPQEIQQMQQNSPSAIAQIKAQTAQALQNQAFDRKEQLADEENYSRAGREVLRHVVAVAATPEAVTGEPGGVGFGSNI
jgi:hypothetical protein